MEGRFLTIWATREAIYKSHDYGTTEEKLLFPEGSKNWILVYEDHRKEVIFDLSHDMFDESINCIESIQNLLNTSLVSKMYFN